MKKKILIAAALFVLPAFGQLSPQSAWGTAAHAYQGDIAFYQKPPVILTGKLGPEVVTNLADGIRVTLFYSNEVEPAEWQRPQSYLVVVKKGPQSRFGFFIRKTIWVGRRFALHSHSYYTADMKIFGGDITF